VHDGDYVWYKRWQFLTVQMDKKAEMDSKRKK